ncbi:MAG TPA: [Fe-Fe] hydrogenase large subunit C-terminal domain-containing protein, partial [Patescibacteria group bacterium]
EGETLLELLKSGEPMVAMVAPSFPIVFDPEKITGELKLAGFQEVVEVTAGAKRTNEMLLTALKENEKARFITGPCPSMVRMIRTKYPQALDYLAMQIDSPMAATARIVMDKFPGKKPVFIGPCLAKRFEAAEDHPELNILCVTYKDVQQIFKELGIEEGMVVKKVPFDIEEESTRLYPFSGGLAQSSGVKEILSDDQIEVVSGWKNGEAALERFLGSNQVRLLDILFCEGGCVNGPGIASTLTIDERRKKVTDYWEKQLQPELK